MEDMWRNVFPKFIEILYGDDGHQHGGRKPAETSVTECCYKSVNYLSKNLKCNNDTCRRQNLVCFVCFSFVPGVSFVVLVSFVLWHFLYMLCSLAYFISSVRA